MSSHQGFAKRKIWLVALSLFILIPVGAGYDNNDINTEAIHDSQMVSLSERNHLVIWESCLKNNLSYELVLAVFYQDGISPAEPQKMTEKIQELSYYRDYWSNLGFSDERVFNLMLLSNRKGVSYCLEKLMEEDQCSIDKDEYVQSVAEKKYFLEQHSEASAYQVLTEINKDAVKI